MIFFLISKVLTKYHTTTSNEDGNDAKFRTHEGFSIMRRTKSTKTSFTDQS